MSDNSTEIFEPCLGLISPSTTVLADSLLNRAAPVPIKKQFFAYNDPARPLWEKPSLILVHASEDFHYPVSIKAPMEKWIEQFHQKNNPVVFIVHNDHFADASYFVRPVQGDYAFYSEDGKHPFCENSPDVTFAGGYIDYCFGLAIRSYIANYFRDKKAGEIRINFAANSIYTEAITKKGEEGKKTALMELQELGSMGFIRKRIAQYLESPEIKEVARALCSVEQPITDECRGLANGIVLSEVNNRDKGGRFYPHLNENQFLFRVQVDGRDAIYPVGQPNSPRKITFNILTEN